LIQFSLRQLQYFVAAADHESIAEAARSLNVSQPSVSMAVAKLEDQLGVQLFLRRHAQGVTPTAAGRRLLGEGRELLSHAHEVQESTEAMGLGLAGEINIGAFVTVAPFYLPRLIRAFETTYPSVRLMLTEDRQDALLNDLAAGRIDCALLYDHELPAGIDKQVLYESLPQVLLPIDHDLAAAELVSLQDLVEEPMVLLDIPPSRDYFTGLFVGHGLRPRISFRTTSFETVRGMVGNGHGFSVLVTRPAGDLTYDGLPLAIRDIAEDVMPGRVVLARMQAVRPTRLTETVAQFCRDFFPQVAVAGDA